MVRHVVLGLMIASRAALAQPTEADQLFEEGRALMEVGKFEQACTKFEQSLAKDPRAIGVLMNLGLCNERSGKISTALRLFQEAFDRASEAGLERARAQAQDEIAKIASKVPRVTLEREEPTLPGEKLLVDDAVVPIDRKELSLDPGSHVLVRTAPGRLPFEKRIELAISQRTTIVLPALIVPSAAPSPSSRRTVGKVMLFAGAGIALVAGALEIYAKRDYDQLFVDPDGTGVGLPHCGGYPPIGGRATCDAEGQTRSNHDRNLGLAATTIASIGAVAIATGVVLWITSPRDGAAIVPIVTSGGAGLALSGRY